MTGIDYKRSFEKLVQQIKTETKWAVQSNMNEPCDYNRGMIFAYMSILELAEKLENNEFFEKEETLD